MPFFGDSGADLASADRNDSGRARLIAALTDQPRPAEPAGCEPIEISATVRHLRRVDP